MEIFIGGGKGREENVKPKSEIVLFNQNAINLYG